MTDSVSEIAERLRAVLNDGLSSVAICNKNDLRALLDHIESSDREMDALLAERAEFKRRAEAAETKLDLLQGECDAKRNIIASLEAELARLRKPVGEVKGVVRSLSLIACAPRCEHASECNCTVLDNAAELIQRLAGQVAEARERTEREVSATRADAWAERTARIAAEARLREAVEVIQYAYDYGWDRGKAETFLATLEDHSNGDENDQ